MNLLPERTSYRVPHKRSSPVDNYLNQKLKIQPAICSKSLVNYETSGNMSLIGELAALATRYTIRLIEFTQKKCSISLRTDTDLHYGMRMLTPCPN